MGGGYSVKTEKAVKKWWAWMCLLCLLTTACRAEGGEWTPETWAQVREALFSEVAEPVPEMYRIHPSADKSEDTSEETWMHVLVMGSDAPDMQRNLGRTDALLLISVHIRTGNVRVISLPEYAMMPVEGLPERVMLRHVNCFGGPLLTVQEVNRALDMNIRRYCAMNLDTFARMIDAMEGVTLNLTEREAQILGTEPGENTLSGEQALRYIKIRRVGDGGQRMQQLLRAMLIQTLKKGSLMTVFGLADQLIAGLDTNMSMADIVNVVLAVLDRQEAGSFASRDVPTEADGSLGAEAARIAREFLEQEDE